MGQAVLGFLGVILGAAIAGSISLWQARLTTERERETRTELRELERKDRRDAFERETMLVLQDACSDVRKAVFRDYERKMADRPGWPVRTPDVLMPEDWAEADDRVIWLHARVFDEELRILVEKFRHAAASAMTAQSQSSADDWIMKASHNLEEINSRISQLLPRLF